MSKDRGKVKIFYSYSHKDEKLLARLKTHLAIMKRMGITEDWYDRMIDAGGEWDREIKTELEEADIILLLVSPDFIDSDYIWGVEVKRAMERHEAKEAVVIPIILRPVDFKGAPFAKLQALPTNARPFTSWADIDRACLDTEQGIRKVVEKIRPELAVVCAVEREGDKERKHIAWNVPYRNPNFTGRAEHLERLQRALLSGTAAAITQAQKATLHGQGGVGKTQIAIEYAHRFADKYRVVWWIKAELTESMRSDFAELAHPLGLPGWQNPDQDAVIAAVRAWLNEHDGWLLIFDNATDKAELKKLVQGLGRGRVIVTSRDQDWGEFAKVQDVDVMTEKEAVDFLCLRVRECKADEARPLAEELGRLPLALEQVAAYLKKTAMPIAKYLELFQTRRKDLWGKEKAGDYGKTVAVALSLNLDQIEKEPEAEAARGLLNLLAFLAADDVPIEMIGKGAEFLPKSLASCAADEVRFAEARAALLKYGLVKAGKDSLSIHRLLQFVVQDRMSEDDKKTWVRAAAGVVAEAFPTDILTNVDSWPVAGRLLPHARAAAGHAEDYDTAPDIAYYLLNEAGLYIQGRGEYKEARTLYERALALAKKAFGEEHPETAAIINNLGEMHRILGELDEAKKCFERALAIGEKTYGPEHPTVASFVNNLGAVLQALGKLDEARKFFERALAIDEKNYGPEHPQVAIRVNNLGEVLRNLGELDEAKKCFERALDIDEKAYGPDHPNVATRVNNQGLVLRALGKLDEARNCFERALAIDEKTYGPEHPEVATDVNNLGSVLQDLGDLEGAEECFERAWKIFAKFLGDDHPTTKIFRHNLEGVRSLPAKKG